MTNSEERILPKIVAAKAELAEAEQRLDALLAELRVAPRAEKTTITAVLEESFAKLRSARAKLNELESLLAEENSKPA